MSRWCHVCDTPLFDGEPRRMIAGQLIHDYCDSSEPGGLCTNDKCAYQFTDHAGVCLD